MLQTTISVLASFLAINGPAPSAPVTLAGSPQSMVRQHTVARVGGYEFLRTARDIRKAVEAGVLVPVRGGDAFAVKDPDDAVTRPEVLHFIQRFGAEYRSACRDRMVVTSLTRPLSHQPRNAHPLSVHPAGMAMDLRVPRTPQCRRWFESTLLKLESQGILDVTRESNPAHYHVAVFPERYLAHLGLKDPALPAVVVPAPAAAPVQEPVTTPFLPQEAGR